MAAAPHTSGGKRPDAPCADCGEPARYFYRTDAGIVPLCVICVDRRRGE